MLIYDPKKIVALREGQGMSQAELARRARLKQPSVWALERGETVMPKFETLHKVASALGVPLQSLLAAKPGGKKGELQEELVAGFGALSPENQAAVLAAVKALLESQKRR